MEEMYCPSGMIHEKLVSIFQGGNRPARSACWLPNDVWVTSDIAPERTDVLRLEDDVQATSNDPEHNDISRLDEVKRRKSMLINAY